MHRRLDEADASYRLALEQANSFAADDQRRVTASNGLACVLRQRGQEEESSRLEDQARTVAGLGHQTKPPCRTQAVISEPASPPSLDQAVPLQETSVPGSGSLPGGDPQALEDMRKKGRAFLLSAKLPESEKCYLAALYMCDRPGSKSSKELTICLKDLAAVYVDEARLPEARLLNERVFALNERSDPGEADAALSTIASTYVSVEDNRPGTQACLNALLEKQLCLRARVWGNNDPRTAATLLDLGVSQRLQHSFQQASRSCKKALPVLAASYGDYSPQVLRCRAELARDYLALNDFKQARLVCYQILDTADTHPDALDREHLKPVQGLSGILTKQGEFGEAAALYRRLIAIREKIQGRRNNETVANLLSLGDCYRLNKEDVRAEQPYRQALTIVSQANKADSAALLIPLTRLADLYYHQHRLAEAEKLLRQRLMIKDEGQQETSALRSRKMLSDILSQSKMGRK